MPAAVDNRRVVGGTCWAKAAAVSTNVYTAALGSTWLEGKVLKVELRKKSTGRGVTWVCATFKIGEDEEEKDTWLPLTSLKHTEPIPTVTNPKAAATRDKKWYGSLAKKKVIEFFRKVHDIAKFEYDPADLYDKHFKGLPEFEPFPWNHLYKGRFDRLHKAIKNKRMWADYDMECLRHDLLLVKLTKRNTRGEVKWYGSNADKMLRKDIEAGVHKVPGFKPDKLRKEKYPEFSARRFNKRIDQIKQAIKPFGMTPGQAKGLPVVGDETLDALVRTDILNQDDKTGELEPPCDERGDGKCSFFVKSKKRTCLNKAMKPTNDPKYCGRHYASSK